MIATATLVVAALTVALVWVSPGGSDRDGGAELPQGDGELSAGPGPRAITTPTDSADVGAPIDPPDAAAPSPAGRPDGGPGAPCERCDPSAPLCFTDRALDAGICTRRCRYGTDCPAGWCCLDTQGAGDPRFMLCAPPAACAGRVTGTLAAPPDGGLRPAPPDAAP
ncbi:MAG: hypothetical protein H6704_04055 [Myxococcales bacterium]|nr:hypothetical protein [Myxococcales bacterium]